MSKPCVYTLNCLEDVFPNSPVGNRTDYSLHMAQNEGESFIIGVHAGDTPLTSLQAEVISDVPDVEWCVHHIALVPFSKNTIHIGSRSVRAKAPGVLPEYFLPDKEITIPAEESRGICVTAYTLPDTAAGTYTVSVNLRGDNFEASIPVTLTVYPVALPHPRDSDFTYVCWTQLLVPENAKRMYGLEMYSEEYWDYVKNCAKVLRRERQNMINIELEHILEYNLSADDQGNWLFDFTMFDRFVDIMLDDRYMGAKYLCGMHLMARDWFIDITPNSGWNQRPLIAWIFEKQSDGTVKRVWKPASDPVVESFHHQLFAALATHLQEKGWDSIWFQHVADEIDNDIHYQQTLAVYQIVHRYMPKARTIDAVRRESPYTFGRELDIHVPLLWHHDMAPAAYDEINNGKTEVWQYTCLQPQFEYLSRLGDYPLVSTRLLNWYNFRHGLKGFLHYAWNNYAPCRQAYNPFADLSCFDSFPCDAFIVYPDKENLTVLESVRSEAQRDTNEDYELLVLAAKNKPDTVRRIVELVITAADDYVRNTEFIMQLRIELLKIASATE